MQGQNSAPLCTKWVNWAAERCTVLSKALEVVTKPDSTQLSRELQECAQHLRHDGLPVRFAGPFYRWENWGQGRLSDHIKHSCQEGKETTLQIAPPSSAPAAGLRHPPTTIRLGLRFQFAVTLSRERTPPPPQWNLKVAFLNHGVFLLLPPHLHKCKIPPERRSYKKHLGLIGVKPAGMLVLPSKAKPWFWILLHCFKRHKFTASCAEASSFSWS